MKFLILSFILFCCATLKMNGQDVLVGQLLQTVPEGKKWILSTESPITVEVSKSTLDAGSKCNSEFLSTPGLAGDIIEGPYGNQNALYRILISDLEPVPKTNEYTYFADSWSIVSGDFTRDELKQVSAASVGISKLEFKPSQKVQISGCLKSVIFREVDIQDANTEISQSSGESIHWSLEGRGLVKGYEGSTKNQKEEGTIVLKIIVNRQGQVISSRWSPLSNTTSTYLTNKAIELAEQVKFSAKADAKAEQHGEIKFVFEVNKSELKGSLPSQSSTNSMEWRLKGRSLVKGYEGTTKTSNEEGIVVLQITVSRQGDVISAKWSPLSNTTSTNLTNNAIRLANQLKFNASEDASVEQNGEVRFVFEVE